MPGTRIPGISFEVDIHFIKVIFKVRAINDRYVILKAGGGVAYAERLADLEYFVDRDRSRGNGRRIFLFYDYYHFSERRIVSLIQHVEEMNAVVQEHTAVINEQASAINNHLAKMSDEYTTTIEEQEQIINEMSDLISRYQEIINQNASYFDEILENLKALSITVSE